MRGLPPPLCSCGLWDPLITAVNWFPTYCPPARLRRTRLCGMGLGLGLRDGVSLPEKPKPSTLGPRGRPAGGDGGL